MPYYTADHHSQRIVYKAPDSVCAACSVQAQCRTGKSGRRVGHSMFKAYLDRVKRTFVTYKLQKLELTFGTHFRHLQIAKVGINFWHI